MSLSSCIQDMKFLLKYNFTQTFRFYPKAKDIKNKEKLFVFSETVINQQENNIDQPMYRFVIHKLKDDD